jgi:integrase
MQPFTREDVATIRAKLTQRGTTRDLALFETALSTLLRASDLVALRVADVTGSKGEIATVATVRQKKTGAVGVVPLTQAARSALAAHIARHALAPDAYLFTNASNSAQSRPLSTTAFRTLAKAWADLAGYTDTRRFSGHSLRRTRAAIIYRETRDIAACAHLLGHTSTAHTKAYLGVGRDQALALSRQFEI